MNTAVVADLDDGTNAVFGDFHETWGEDPEHRGSQGLLQPSFASSPSPPLTSYSYLILILILILKTGRPLTLAE
jgi:hypothetical protein